MERLQFAEWVEKRRLTSKSFSFPPRMTPPRGESRRRKHRHFGGHRCAVTPLAPPRTADDTFLSRDFDLYDSGDLGAVRQIGLRLVLSQFSSRVANYDDLSPRMFPVERVHPVAWVREFLSLGLRCDYANSSNCTRPANAAAPQRMSPPRGHSTERLPSRPTKAPEHLPVESSRWHEPRMPDCVFSPSLEALL